MPETWIKYSTEESKYGGQIIFFKSVEQLSGYPRMLKTVVTDADGRTVKVLYKTYNPEMRNYQTTPCMNRSEKKMTKEELYNDVWQLWEDMQLDILIEEMAELIHALIKARRRNMLWSHAVFEEIADVMICLEIVGNRLKALPTDIDRETDRPTGYLYDIVEELKASKIARLEERVFTAKVMRAEVEQERY